MGKIRFKIEDALGYFYSENIEQGGLSVSHTKNKPEMFTMLKKINGKLIFRGQNYLRLESIRQSENKWMPIKCSIQEFKNGFWVTIESGYLSLINGNWDVDNCKVEVSFEKDEFEKFIDKTEPVNIFPFVQERVTVNTTPYNENQEDDIAYTIEEYNAELLNPQQQGYAQTYWREEKSHGSPIYTWSMGYRVFVGCSNEQETKSYFFKYKRYVAMIPIANPIPSGWIDLNQNDGTNKKIARVPGTTGPVETQYWQDECNYNTAKVWEIVDNVAEQNHQTPNINISNGLKLSSILQVLCSPFGVVPKSDFFFINSQDEINRQINYVTGENSTTSGIVLFQKTDVKKHNATEDAKIFNISLKELLKWLYSMFNIRYGIVGSQLVIEHVSFFESTTIRDLTAEPFKSQIAGHRKFSYNVDELPYKESFKWMEQRPENYGMNDFSGLPILYNILNQRPSENEISYAVDKITTDLEYILELGENSDLISDDGFVLVSTNVDENGVHHIIRKPAILSLTKRVNNVMGWAHLHNDFWRHDRYFKKGKMNNSLTNFINSKNIIKGEKINIIECNIEDFNTNDFFKTLLGKGKVLSAKYDFFQKNMELELTYDDDDTQIVPTTQIPTANRDIATFGIFGISEKDSIVHVDWGSGVLTQSVTSYNGAVYMWYASFDPDVITRPRTIYIKAKVDGKEFSPIVEFYLQY